jgi:predicted dehydrogenase
MSGFQIARGVSAAALVRTGFFGRILSVRIDFGYWVFDGREAPSQRPSWNYRSEDGGGIILDMFAHWRYVIDEIFGPVRSLVAVGATHIPDRMDESSRPYLATAEDAAYAVMTLDGGTVVQINSRWPSCRRHAASAGRLALWPSSP